MTIAKMKVMRALTAKALKAEQDVLAGFQVKPISNRSTQDHEMINLCRGRVDALVAVSDALHGNTVSLRIFCRE